MRRFLDESRWRKWRPWFACLLLSAVLVGCAGEPPLRAGPQGVATAPATAAVNGRESTADSPLTPDPAAGVTPIPAASTSPVAVAGTPDAAPAPVSPTPSPMSLTPSPTPDPGSRLEAGRWLQQIGDCANARRELAAVLAEEGAGGISAADIVEVRYRMAECYMLDDAPAEAAAVLQDLLADPPVAGPYQVRAHFLLAEALASTEAWADAEASYLAYLAETPELASFVWQQIAVLRQAAGTGATPAAGVEEAYTKALESSTGWQDTVAIRRALAELASARGDERAAAAQYDLLRGDAVQGAWAAEMQWLAGSALDRAGDPTAAIERWRAATEAAPPSPHAYLALIALVDAEAPVDEFQRGLIDYHNESYQAAIDAFERYRSTDPQGRQGEAWYYEGLSFLGLKQYARGIAELGNFIAAYPDSLLWNDAWLAKARAQALAGEISAARATYREFIELRPEAPQAAKALWAATLLEDEGEAAAAAAYLAFARRYPAADQAWQAYLTAGLNYFCLGDWRRAADAWNEMAEAALPAWTRPVAYYWLGRAQAAAGEMQTARQSWTRAWQEGPLSFHGMRAADWMADTGQPLAGATAATAPDDDESLAEATAAIEGWLRTWAGDGTAGLSATILADADWRRGAALLAIGQREPALAAWAQVQQRYADDPWDLAGLALAFREAGAYNLAIVCAERLAALGPAGGLASAPPALQRLAYPFPLARLIREQAQEQGVDPRLVAAMIRQESRFETGATSYAAAQGLMQIIPDTAAWVATQLGWHNFSPEQIFRPYVNIHFGAYYLAWALESFDGDVAAALAGYNGGPGNAARWQTQAPGDADLMVALIDFTESRIYVQRVWENYEMYRRLYSE